MVYMLFHNCKPKLLCLYKMLLKTKPLSAYEARIQQRYFKVNECLMLRWLNVTWELCYFPVCICVVLGDHVYIRHACVCWYRVDGASCSNLLEPVWLLPFLLFVWPPLVSCLNQPKQCVCFLPGPTHQRVTQLVKGLYSSADPANTLSCSASSPVSPLWLPDKADTTQCIELQ